MLFLSFLDNYLSDKNLKSVDSFEIEHINFWLWMKYLLMFLNLGHSHQQFWDALLSRFQTDKKWTLG